MCRGPIRATFEGESLEFRNYKGEIERIEKEGTPEWMLLLLGAVEVGHLRPLPRPQLDLEMLTVIYLFQDAIGPEPRSGVSRFR